MGKITDPTDDSIDESSIKSEEMHSTKKYEDRVNLNASSIIKGFLHSIDDELKAA